jgi:hypothetical protein
MRKHLNNSKVATSVDDTNILIGDIYYNSVEKIVIMNILQIPQIHSTETLISSNLIFKKGDEREPTDDHGNIIK